MVLTSSDPTRLASFPYWKMNFFMKILCVTIPLDIGGHFWKDSIQKMAHVDAKSLRETSLHEAFCVHIGVYEGVFLI